MISCGWRSWRRACWRKTRSCCASHRSSADCRERYH